MNIPIVNSAWLRLLEGILGKTGLKPEDLSKSFYCRAYFNMGTMGILFNKMGLPKNSLESLMGRKDPSGKNTFKPSLKMMVYLPRMLLFFLSNMNVGKQFEKKLPYFKQNYFELKQQLENNYQPEKHAAIFDELMRLSKEIAYYNIILPILNQVFTRRLKKKLVKNGLRLENIQFSNAFPNLNNFRTDEELNELRTVWNNFSDKEREENKVWILDENYTQKESQDFRIKFQRFIQKFGHFSESGNDFSFTPWRDNPHFLIDQLEIKATDRNPRESKKEIITPQVLKSKKIYKSFKKAGKYLLYRERVSSEYTKIYGLFRTLFLNSARHLMREGKIESADNVFYLITEEINILLNQNKDEEQQKIKANIEIRKKEMFEVENVQVPDIIYGDSPPPLTKKDEKVFEGTPVSTGIFEGEIVVVKGYSDFKKDVENAILVIPFSDVGWTPILSKAGAIVSQSGGMLSHASIIARELSIPAIASVDNICNLEDGTKAKVDGNNGILIIQN